MDEFLKYRQVYTQQQISLISQEFSRLAGLHYLEHAGATLYSEKQLAGIVSQLSANLYANPHARNLSSKLTEDGVDILRFKVLKHFKTDPQEYSVVFTAGATAALKLVAESFDYGDDGGFVYLQDNHTSVLGIRAHAQTSACLTVERAFESILSGAQPNEACACNSLFAFPAQSNFSGVKYPLSWISHVKQAALNRTVGSKCQNWYVVLDAASFCSTNELNLAEIKPDFVALSFYKIFGYPTGLGALLVRNTSENVLKKRYFGGGTVLMAQTLTNQAIFRDVLHERFEDGTIPFLSILALREGFNTLERLSLNLELIAKHTFSLAQYTYRNLVSLHHSSGRPVAILYHLGQFDDNSTQGSIINFNLLRENGEHVGFSEVLHFSNLYNIQLRTGCFCNPGACQYFLKLTPEDVQKHFKAGHVCGDQHDLVNGYPTGSVRISFGYMSTKDDADKFLEMIKDCFVTTPILLQLPHKNFYNIGKNCLINKGNLYNGNTFEEGILEQIVLYPVKSCGGFSVLTKWPITKTGLKYDRQWMVINSLGVCLTQKNNRNMCLIRPKIDTASRVLSLSYPGKQKVVLSISDFEEKNEGSWCQSKLCGDQIEGWDCGRDVADWLSEALECPGLRLFKLKDETTARTSKKNEKLNLSLANKAQYLVVNISSVEWLRHQVKSADGAFSEPLETTIQRFRPNFVVKFYNPFAENDYKRYIIDGLKFEAGGVCTRCQMICIDQNTGRATKEPLQSLSKAFKGRISFGVYLNRSVTKNGEFIQVGDKVKGLRQPKT